MGYSHGKRWTEQEIIEKVQYLVKTLEIILAVFPKSSSGKESLNCLFNKYPKY